MKSHALLFFSLLSAFFLKAQWELQISGTSEELNSVHFVNENSGSICGMNGTILHTSDGGENWILDPTWTDLNLVSVYFFNETEGFVLARSEEDFHSELFYTNNGGIDWNLKLTLYKYCDKLFFIDEFRGWIAGQSAIWRTTDGGESWMTQSSGLPDRYYTYVYFINNQSGWAVAANYSDSIAYKSSDGGMTWEEMYLPESGYMESVFFLDENNGWITCNHLFTTPYGIILRTTDGGNSWNIVFEDLGYWFMEIYFSEENTGWVVGAFSEYYSVYQTVDGGLNWTGLYPYGNWTNEIHVENDYGWVVGQEGTILHNNNLTVGDNVNSTEKEMPVSIDCYPNPFKSLTTFEITITDQDSQIDLFIYNSKGILIEKLIESKKYQAGIHRFKWNKNSELGEQVQAGIYFYKLISDGQMQVKKAIAVK